METEPLGLIPVVCTQGILGVLGQWGHVHYLGSSKCFSTEVCYGQYYFGRRSGGAHLLMGLLVRRVLD